MIDSTTWMPLTEYSLKYKVSVSTLRRRIKNEDIKFRFDDGKYFIFDEPLSSHQRDHRPSLSGMSFVDEKALSNASEAFDLNSVKNMTSGLGGVGATSISNFHIPPKDNSQKKEEEILFSTNKLLTELKRAYALVLQEKEEQILQLKEEAADLKTLIKVLEDDNNRLRNRLNISL